MKTPTTWETIEQCAKRLTLSSRTLRRLIKDGAIPAHSLGMRRIVLDPEEVDGAIYKTRRAA
jgi:excisionase family DNA binding protein